MSNFGASFKKARESKGISIDQIASETKISARFLAAIENEEFQLLPGGIFNRGFVRAYAESVGLDADQIVADFKRLTEVQELNDSPAAQPTKGERRLYPFAVAILALAIVVFYIVTRESGRTPQTPTAAPAPAQAPDLVPPPVAQPVKPDAPATPPQTTTPAPEPVAAGVPTQALTLVIEALAQTWIKVTADGNAVNPGEMLEAGMSRKFTAQSALRVAVGNAGGLTLQLNDQPVKPLGKSGEVRELTITPDNLKDFIG
jgi:cytoskeleton protein RodZ